MVFVKVRETYDLHTQQNKMTVIGIHTPKPDIIVKNYPGLLMQCRAYRPVSADVRLACASVLPLDPLGVGTSPGDVAPEDVFNPILYKAMSNKGMSQLESRINSYIFVSSSADIDGNTSSVDVDSFTDQSDEFSIYYGLLSNTHDWRHANPQSGLEMKGLKPFVYEMVYNVGDMVDGGTADLFASPMANSTALNSNLKRIVGDAKPMPFINCTSYSKTGSGVGVAHNGMSTSNPFNAEMNVPYLNVFCGCIIVPPSRLHSLYFRMVVEWTIEFSKLRPIAEITDWSGLQTIGGSTHYQNYSYSSTKEAITGDSETMLNNDSCMVATNAEVEKVM